MAICPSLFLKQLDMERNVKYIQKCFNSETTLGK
jgi:hypothetical protein